MNPLRQYLDLYTQNRVLLESNSARVLNELRQKAYESLKDAELPKKGSENHEMIDYEKILAPDYGINLARVPIDVNPAESFRCEVPNMSTSLYFLINDIFAESSTARRATPGEIKVCSLRKAAVEFPELVEEYYGKIADISQPLVALNTLLAQDGVFIYIPKGFKCEKTIQLVNILHSLQPLMAIRRILLVAEEESEISLLVCDHTQTEGVNLATLQVVEIIAKEGSKIDVYDLEESSLETNRVSTLWLRQEGKSDVMLNGITLYNGTTRNEYHTEFKGRGASLHLLGMGIEDKNRVLDTYSYINHATPECFTKELFKYVVDDEAKGAFTGMIYVAPGAVKTEAYQTSRNLVENEKARMYAKPQLEIYNDDVKCSHGTAIGQLDEMQLFYMQTRGIPMHQARLLLKQAFMMDVIDAVRVDQLRERLRHLVEVRFEGRKSACAACHGEL